MLDREQRLREFVFELLPGDFPILLELEIYIFVVRNCVAQDVFLCIKHPTDSVLHTFRVCIIPDIDNPLCERIKLSIISESHTFITAFASVTLQRKSKRAPPVFAKRMNRLTHASSGRVKSVRRQAVIRKDVFENEIEKLTNACEICSGTGWPATSKIISLTHVNEAFNMELQMEYAPKTVRDMKSIIFLMKDKDTDFSERAMTSSRDNGTIYIKVEKVWIPRHDAPAANSADREYTKQTTGSITGLRCPEYAQKGEAKGF